MNLQDKFKVICGKNCWESEACSPSIDSLRVSDGPHGLRYVYDSDNEKQYSYKSVSYPTSSILSCSFNEDTIRKVGQALADDCIAKGVDIILGPGVNIKRTPLCGRNFEYYSEDPYLAGTLARAYINGVQERGIGTSLKHFACNNRERDRFFQSSEVDERTMHEIYLEAFRIAIQAKPWTVMCSYNPVNGVYASENKYLLNDVLRNEFAFSGVVVSDWGAVRDRVKSLKAGVDLSMPDNQEFVPQLEKAERESKLPMKELDESVSRLEQLTNKNREAKKIRKVIYSRDDKLEIAKQAALDSIVLLKNDGILPLNGDNIYVVGQYACKTPIAGGGSSSVNTETIETLPECLRKYTSSHVSFDNGYLARDGFYNIFGYKPVLMNAVDKDAIIVAVGNDSFIETEERDRENISLPSAQLDLISSLAKVNDNIIVVIYAGSAIDVSPFKDKVKAIVYAGFAGEKVNDALALLLLGKENFAGRLSETFPLSLSDTPTGTDTGNYLYERYEEGVFVGYRYYDYYQKEVNYCFGYGLSYSCFEYSNFTVENSNDGFDIAVDVKNVSSVDGKEVVQIYVGERNSTVSRPIKELKAYKKDEIRASEKKTFRFHLSYRDFAFYSETLHSYYVENGVYDIYIGSSVRDIKERTKVTINLDPSDQYSKY